MPTYGFRCARCGSRRELFQRWSDPIPLCCGEPMGRTVGGGVGFVLRGGGWPGKALRRGDGEAGAGSRPMM